MSKINLPDGWYKLNSNEEDGKRRAVRDVGFRYDYWAYIQGGEVWSLTAALEDTKKFFAPSPSPQYLQEAKVRWGCRIESLLPQIDEWADELIIGEPE